MIDEGYIKFKINWDQKENNFPYDILDLMEWRDKMHEMNLIGHYKEHNVGFGNISERFDDSKQFIISATQTGDIYPIEEKHFTTVTNYNIEENTVWCKGPLKASSESMTHAAIYECDKGIRAVIHIHHLELWNKLLDEIPTSGADVPYGTPEMAMEIKRLFKEENLGQKKIMAMAGHDEGIIAFGANLDEAAAIIMDYYNELKNQ